MKFNLIRNDISRNKIITVTTVLFIAAAAMLMSLAASLAMDLAGSIDRLMTDAKTPHFLQMHAGKLPIDELEAFAEQNRDVKDFQVLEFLNLDSSKFRLGKHPLTGSLQDNGLSTQSSRFDFLLDLNQTPIRPKQGELYVPVCYLKDGLVKEGDVAVVGGITFTVAGFVRDSQMNSMLASSKRFVVNDNDYRQLLADGTIEYLIEFRLHDRSRLGAFETAYRNAGLPANGPSLTWPLFQMINAVTDGILIAVILLVSILIIVIALLCIRFTLQAKIEDDYREIGVMKAVGMRISQIQNLYLTIYAAMAVTGAALGFLLSLPVIGVMQEQIRLNFGESGHPLLSMPAGLAAAVLLVLLVLLYVAAQLKRVRAISPVQAIRFGAEQESGRVLKTFSLSENRYLSIGLLLAFRDVLARKRLYSTMLVVMILASFIMIVPQNLYHTISSRNFITYMGVGVCDLRLDIQQVDEIDKKAADIGAFMELDPSLAKHALYITKMYTMKQSDGTRETLKVELGDHTVYPLQYTEGHMPTTSQEIALSILEAEELGKRVGDQITIDTGEGRKMLTVCGIYPDITNGGKTAKAAFFDPATQAAWATVCATLSESGHGALDEIIDNYNRHFPFAKISSIDEYVAQTFGQTLDAVRSASWIAILAAAFVTLLVTLLFLKLLITKDRFSIAVMRALGFTGDHIRRQYGWRAVFVLVIGILAGTLFANTIGEQLAGLAISGSGAAAFHFQINLLSTFLLSPLVLLAAALTAAVFGTRRAGEVSICESIKE